MPNVIAIANQKGGVGKSTIAKNLYHSFQKKGADTALVDIDVQGTLMDVDIDIPILQDGVAVPGQTKKLMGVQTYDPLQPNFLRQLPNQLVIVDTPPYVSEHMLSILTQSDLVIIPTRIGIADVLAIRKTVSLVKEAQKINPNLRAFILFNMVKNGTTLTESIKTELLQFGLPIFKTYILDRVSFTRSIAAKDGIYSLSDPKAEEELAGLSVESLLALNGISGEKEIDKALAQMNKELAGKSSKKKNAKLATDKNQLAVVKK